MERRIEEGGKRTIEGRGEERRKERRVERGGGEIKGKKKKSENGG